MKKIAFLAALASLTGVSFAAQADNVNNTYLSLSGGVGFLSDQTDDNLNVTKTFDVGPAFDVAIGHRLDAGRVELEVGYLSNHIKQLTVDGVSLSSQGDTSGTTSAVPIMLAGFYDFNFQHNRSFIPYVGAGLGVVNVDEVTHTTLSDNSGNNFQVNENDHNLLFGYELMAGFNTYFNQNFSMGLGYKFLGTTRGAYQANYSLNGNAIPVTYHDNYFNNVVMVNLNYDFA